MATTNLKAAIHRHMVLTGLNKPKGKTMLVHDRTGGMNDTKKVFNFTPIHMATLIHGFEFLNAYRKQCIRERDFWLLEKKNIRNLPAGDRKEYGRFVKEQEAFWRKQHKACCYIIGYVFAPDDIGDCPYHEPYYWPQELFDNYTFVIDNIMAAIDNG